MKRKYIAAFAGLAAAASFGGSLAYFNQNLTAVNQLSVNGSYDTEIVEYFNPEEGKNWKPGETVPKEFSVKNTGDIPVIVRVSFEESWSRGKKKPFITIHTGRRDDESGRQEPPDLAIVPDSELPEGENPPRNKFESVYQSDAEDGAASAEEDDSVVHKKLVLTKKSGWSYNPGDGYYYYTKKLPGGEPTGVLLESVTLADDTDIGELSRTMFYSVEDTEENTEPTTWFPFPEDVKTVAELSEWLKGPEGQRKHGEDAQIHRIKSEISTMGNPEKQGYANADYCLTIQAETVQATKKAVDEVFPGASDYAAKQGWQWDLQ